MYRRSRVTFFGLVCARLPWLIVGVGRGCGWNTQFLARSFRRTGNEDDVLLWYGEAAFLVSRLDSQRLTGTRRNRRRRGARNNGQVASTHALVDRLCPLTPRTVTILALLLGDLGSLVKDLVWMREKERDDRGGEAIVERERGGLLWAEERASERERKFVQVDVERFLRLGGLDHFDQVDDDGAEDLPGYLVVS